MIHRRCSASSRPQHLADGDMTGAGSRTVVGLTWSTPTTAPTHSTCSPSSASSAVHEPPRIVAEPQGELDVPPSTVSNRTFILVPMASLRRHTFARPGGPGAAAVSSSTAALAVENALGSPSTEEPLPTRSGTTWNSALAGTTCAALFHGYRSGYRLYQHRPNKVARLEPTYASPTRAGRFARAAMEAESVRQARAAFEAVPARHRLHRRADPGRGGDRHFRPQFFVAMRELCDESIAPLIVDEVHRLLQASPVRPGHTSNSVSTRRGRLRQKRRCAASWPGGASTRSPTTCSPSVRQ